MKNKNEKGFSVVELLLVCVIIGVIASLAVPALLKARRAAENASAFSTLRTISSTQVGFYSSNRRFGRLDEMNNVLNLGTVGTNQLFRGAYTFAMTPAAPTNDELRDGFIITATRNLTGSDDTPYVYELTQSGFIRQVLPPLPPDS